MTASKIKSLLDLDPLYTGKVREVYDAGDDRLLLVTSNRVSAYDVVFPEPVPKKGEVLNLLSAWWFGHTAHLTENHLIETRADHIFAADAEERRTLRGRVALARRTDPIRFECVVRGHLDGSAWREYQETGVVAGHKLPSGLARYDQLPKPLFTPATKADTGHDINVTFEFMAKELGEKLASHLRSVSLALYTYAYDELVPRGVLLLDTKFEFGLIGDQVILIDEIFTPDSSRYRVQRQGESTPLALDKQYLRDWLAEQGFTGDGQPPRLPEDVVRELGERYEQALKMITGEKLEEAMLHRG